MAANQPTRKLITSFMLRFVREAEAEEVNSALADEAGANIATIELDLKAAPGWRGVIKHIQSGAEQHFTTLDEAESFMKKYIES